MSQSFTTEFWGKVRGFFSPSVVQLAVYKEGSIAPVNLGTGIILVDALPKSLGKRSRTTQSNSICVLTTMACYEDAKESDYRVVAKVDDSGELRAIVFKKVKIFTALAIMGIPDEYTYKIKVLNGASFHNGNIQNAEPVVAVGCFSKLLKQIVPPGYVSISDINLVVGGGGEPSRAFTHSCPIGDGLIGAPVINRHCKIIGVNFRRTTQSSKVNYALKSEELNSVLAQILDEEDHKKPMSSLLEMLKVQIVDWMIGASPAKKTDGASSSSATVK